MVVRRAVMGEKTTTDVLEPNRVVRDPSDIQPGDINQRGAKKQATDGHGVNIRQADIAQISNRHRATIKPGGLVAIIFHSVVSDASQRVSTQPGFEVRRGAQKQPADRHRENIRQTDTEQTPTTTGMEQISSRAALW